MEEWKPQGVLDVIGEFADEYPDRAKEGHWWLLGTWEDNRALYYDDEEHVERMVTQSDEAMFESIGRQAIQDDLAYPDYVLIRSESDDAWNTWSRYTWPVYEANNLSTVVGGLLPREQAIVYIFREFYDVERRDVAQLLGKSPNTIDNQYRDARKKIEGAEKLIERHNNLIEIHR